MTRPVLSVRNLHRAYKSGGGLLKVLAGADIDIFPARRFRLHFARQRRCCSLQPLAQPVTRHSVEEEPRDSHFGGEDFALAVDMVVTIRLDEDEAAHAEPHEAHPRLATVILHHGERAVRANLPPLSCRPGSIGT